MTGKSTNRLSVSLLARAADGTFQSLQPRSPFVATVAALAVSLFKLARRHFRRCPSKPTGSVRKVKLESYSFSPLEAGRRTKRVLEASSKLPRTSPDTWLAGSRRKGGC